MNSFFQKIKKTKYPYIVAEIGSNHNGDMNLAKKLILSAKKNGADCVKFQSWKSDSIFSKKKYEDNFFLKDDYRNRKDYSLKTIVNKFSVSESELIELKNYSKKIDIDFATTPFSFQEAKFIKDRLKCNFIKVASMDVNNIPFLKYLGGLKLPIIISTGLSDLSEITKAINTLEIAGCYEIILLHCVAIYPVKDKDVNLNNIDTLKKIYPQYPIGFSDHSLGSSITLASVVKGVKIIEKHFTLDKEMFGWDHKVSASPDELATICFQSKRIIDSLGTSKIVKPENQNRINEFRRSIVAKKSLKKNHKLKYSDIDYKRPGIGISPDRADIIIGRKLNKTIKQDHILKFSDFD